MPEVFSSGAGSGWALASVRQGRARRCRRPMVTRPATSLFSGEQFRSAREKAWGVAARYDIGPGTLLPVHIPGLSLLVRYAEGRDAINASTGVGLPTVREGNLDIIWNVPGVPGLQLRFRNAYVAESGNRVVRAFRIILNYELPLL